MAVPNNRAALGAQGRALNPCMRQAGGFASGWPGWWRPLCCSSPRMITRAPPGPGDTANRTRAVNAPAGRGMALLRPDGGASIWPATAENSFLTRYKIRLTGTWAAMRHQRVKPLNCYIIISQSTHIAKNANNCSFLKQIHCLIITIISPVFTFSCWVVLRAPASYRTRHYNCAVW